MEGLSIVSWRARIAVKVCLQDIIIQYYVERNHRVVPVIFDKIS